MGSGPARWLEKGRRLHRSGDYEGALTEYERCLGASPGNADLCLLAAMAASQAGRAADAERYARRAYEARPDARAAMSLGQVLLAAGAYEEAAMRFERAASDPALSADANFRRGQALRRLGRTEDAIAALESAVLGAGRHAPAWNELGVSRLEADQPRLAVEAFRRSLAARQDDAAVLSNLAAAEFRVGDLDAAAAAVRSALEIDPTHACALAMLGRLERSRGQLDAAADAFERSVATQPDHASAWAGLAGVRQARGDLAGADEAYRRALEFSPGDADAVAGKAEWYEWQGRYQEGLDFLRDADAAADDPGIELVTGRLLRRVGRLEEARRRLEAAAPAGDSDGPLRRQFCFSLGDVCDAEGDFRSAWDWYAEGNRLTPASFDPAADAARLGRFDDLGSADGHGLGDGVVFIVGMPRSGTTLGEQILASHPRVYAAGELPHLGRLAQGMPVDAAGREADWTGLGRSYLDALPVVPGEDRLVTDKMPLNFRYLGVIRRALPGARIVHCRRDPRDAALSCFFTDFIDPALGFATRLEWLADFSNAYLRHMSDWSGRLGGRMFGLRYERLVDRPREVIGELLGFLGLGWDEACMEFHRAERVAATASHAQVRRPLYRTSVGRWKSYATGLEPFLSRLEFEDADG